MSKRTVIKRAAARGNESRAASFVDEDASVTVRLSDFLLGGCGSDPADLTVR